MNTYRLYEGDNILSLKKLPDNSISAVITDPPYGLSFMNKKWDYQVPSIELWREVFRVLKPGGHVLSFGGSRTYHRTVLNIEEAGFEIRDQLIWLYAQGFPKSHNIGKAVDKLEGNKREVIGKLENYQDKRSGKEGNPAMMELVKPRIDIEITKGQSAYEGWGTGLKPAHEPICLARKPLDKKNIAENAIKWKTGGINIDRCRISKDNEEGRFPANLIFECICDEVIMGEKGQPYLYKGKEYNNKDLEGNRQIDFLKGSKAEAPNNYNDKNDIHTNPMCPCYLLDKQSGISKSSKGINKGRKNGVHEYGFKGENPFEFGFNDKGGASRFFYQAKVSKQERGLATSLKNTHPTVKPVALMTYLCRLITPPEGIILDPFMGSGSTGIAALLEGFKFVGMEIDPNYIKVAEQRIKNYEEYRKFLK